MEHVLRIEEDYWNCECGIGGSGNLDKGYDPELHAEKHIDFDEGDTVIKRHHG